MFAHLVLGVLRDGRPRHGYDVSGELRARCGIGLNPGNVYREFGKLSSDHLIEPIERAPDVDPRRNPYRICAAGCDHFDAWLRSPDTQEHDLANWLAFIDRLSADELPALLEEVQERLWLRSKSFVRDRDVLLINARSRGERPEWQVGAVRSLFELKQVTAALELIDELRRSISPGHNGRSKARRRDA